MGAFRRKGGMHLFLPDYGKIGYVGKCNSE